MSETSSHPALAADLRGLVVCVDARCGSVLPSDAEICDECGGTRFAPLGDIDAMLCGWAEARPLVFKLPRDRPALIGRATPNETAPDIDLSRLPGSGAVHRRHARIEMLSGVWRVTHLGRNALVVGGWDRAVVPPGGSATLRSGDTLEVGGVPLQLVVRDSAQRI